MSLRKLPFAVKLQQHVFSFLTRGKISQWKSTHHHDNNNSNNNDGEENEWEWMFGILFLHFHSIQMCVEKERERERNYGVCVFSSERSNERQCNYSYHHFIIQHCGIAYCECNRRVLPSAPREQDLIFYILLAKFRYSLSDVTRTWYTRITFYFIYYTHRKKKKKWKMFFDRGVIDTFFGEL